MGNRRNGPYVRYSALPTQDGDLLNEDYRYLFELRQEIPWKSVALALFLLALGTLFLMTSHLIFSQHMGGDSDQGFGFLTVGILLLLPGFYESRIAYYAWRGYKGYAFSSIPAF